MNNKKFSVFSINSFLCLIYLFFCGCSGGNSNTAYLRILTEGGDVCFNCLVYLPEMIGTGFVDGNGQTCADPSDAKDPQFEDDEIQSGDCTDSLGDAQVLVDCLNLDSNPENTEQSVLIVLDAEDPANDDALYVNCNEVSNSSPDDRLIFLTILPDQK